MNHPTSKGIDDLENEKRDYDKINNKGYEKIANIHNFLEMTLGDYVFFVPKTGKEIMEEAKYMHNCL